MIYIEGTLAIQEQKLQVNLKKHTHKAMANNIHEMYKNFAIHQNATCSIYMNVSYI